MNTKQISDEFMKELVSEELFIKNMSQEDKEDILRSLRRHYTDILELVGKNPSTISTKLSRGLTLQTLSWLVKFHPDMRHEMSQKSAEALLNLQETSDSFSVRVLAYQLLSGCTVLEAFQQLEKK